jgi:hypothetical protein
MDDWMNSLKLPRYGLTQYVDATKVKAASETENTILDNLSRAGVRMMGFCRTNFFKRLDSSGVAFLISLYRHILRNSIYIYAIENKLPLPIGDEGRLPDGYTDDDDLEVTLFENKAKNQLETEKRIAFPTELASYINNAKSYYDSISANVNTIDWIDSRFFKRSLKQDIIADCEILIAMMKHCGAWNPTTDQKLNTLQTMLTETHRDTKVLVFTQFSDTANYIANQLMDRGVKTLCCVTGDSKNPTAIAERFSPQSNNKEFSQEQQYRVLIATDVLSEGQNLQDAHIVVNYDLPWAIIRLIQRAGRVDRIGQTAEQIYCYSFFPAEGIESIINLRRRLNQRINENAHIVGGDEIFFEGNEQNLMDIYNEKNGALDEEDDGEVDLASQAFQIWKTATEANPKLKQIIPSLSNVIYSTKKNSVESIKEGVITYAKTPNGNDMLMWMDTKKNVVTQSQQAILNALACPIDETPVTPLGVHHELVGQSISLMQQQEVKTSGILGSRFSTKYRLFTLLDGYCKSGKGTLFITDELKLAVDDIYNYPLRENAKYILGQQLKRAACVEDIADLVVELRKNDELCIINEDDNLRKEPQIICSMGLKTITN